MRDTLGESLRKLKRMRIHKSRMTALVLALSLVVSLDVFWVLRQPGLTLAGDAACGIREHVHDDTCTQQICICELSEEEEHIHEDACYEEELVCSLEEHTHSIDCYSDETADVETPLDWQEMFADYPYTGNLREDLVGIARTQAGYTESTLNFEVDRDGERHGYTRYGAWYGAPYGDWSGTFVSFCLHYAGTDPEETPGNTGAASMARLWDKLGKYAPAGAYTPVAGDLVFFEDNTAGIVTEVYNATFYVLRGDVDDAVCGETMSLYDESISGWGVTEGTVSEEEPPPEEEAPSEIDIPEFTEDDDWDVTQGPRFTISAKSNEEPAMQTFGLKRMAAEEEPENPEDPPETRSTPQDLIQYLAANGGSYSFTLVDLNKVELPKDNNGNYIATAETTYELALYMNNPNGFYSGTYVYQLPAGLMIIQGKGEFILQDGTNVGTWEIGTDGKITIILNEEMNKRTEVKITAQMGVQFAVQDEHIDFDGKISVTVGDPPVEESPTEIIKWGHQGGTREDKPSHTDPSKIYWQIVITGHNGSEIPGSLLTDQVMFNEYYEKHHYTESDIAAGLSIGVGTPDGGWYQWTVSADDPNLTWTETGWSYTMPTTTPLGVALGNDGWVYYIDYTSTPDPSTSKGTVYYTNHIQVGDLHLNGTADFQHSEVQADVFKAGSFLGDAESGAFHWEVQVLLPGIEDGEKAEYRWYFYDYLRMVDNAYNIIGYVTNDINLAKVTVTNNGTTVAIPNIHDATENDLFAWHDGDWPPTEGGIEYGRQIDLLCRCHCTEENCPTWADGKCNGSYWFNRGDGVWIENGFCQCWTETSPTVFTFSYETEDPAVIENFGGQGNVLRNEVVLYNQNPADEHDYWYIADTNAAVTIPSMIKKEDLTEDLNGRTAHYQVTVNEAKIALTSGDPLVIHDVMSQTLAYINGSMVITTEDANGNIDFLYEGADFTVTYDGTGNVTDHGKPVHVLDINILRPQPVMYILDYDALFVIPSNAEGNVKYSNYVSIQLWGQDLADSTIEKTYTNINISASTYRVDLHKTDSQTGKSLSGATFGLFNAQGGLVSTGVTDSNGRAYFETNLIEGIIFLEHQLYYLQEIQAPPGYRLDDTKYWFSFCNQSGETCGEFNEVAGEVNAIRIPYDTEVIIEIENDLMHYDLPATGGVGVYPLILVSVMLVLTPLVYIPIRRRKQERRGVG